MKLSKDQRIALQQLKKHDWFKVLELIEQEARAELGELLLVSDLADNDHLDMIKKNQLYVKSRKDFLENIDKHVQESYEPSI